MPVVYAEARAGALRATSRMCMLRGVYTVFRGISAFLSVGTRHRKRCAAWRYARPAGRDKTFKTETGFAWMDAGPGAPEPDEIEKCQKTPHPYWLALPVAGANSTPASLCPRSIT